MIVGTVANARSVIVPVGPVSKFYLPSAQAAPISPAPSSAWVHGTGTFVRKLLARTPAGGALNTSSASESIAGGSQLGICNQFVSEPLQAQLISGVEVRCVMGAIMSATGMNFQLRLGLRVLSNDGLTSRGVLLSPSTATSPGSAFSSTSAFTRICDWQGLGTVTAQDGDRLVLETGWFTNNTTSSVRSGTLTYGDPLTADLAFAEGQASHIDRPWVEFSTPLQLA